MKKVPIIGDLEQGMDNTIKDLMGPLKAFYPLLKAGVILSNPATAMSYAAYRSIPYCIDALKSKKAIETYKKLGTATCKGISKIGLGAVKLGAKYTKQAALSIGAIASKQASKLNHYIKDKYNEYQQNKTRDNSFEFDVDNDEFEFDEVSFEQESDFECESANYDDEIEVGEDEVEFNFAEVGNNCMFRFTRDSEGNIRQYITFNHNISQARIISENEYNKFYDDYKKTYDVSEEKEIEQDNEYEI